MDPVVVWERILEQANTLVQDDGSHDLSVRLHPHVRRQLIVDLAYDIACLGEWFEKGGHAPNGKTPKRKTNKALIS